MLIRPIINISWRKAVPVVAVMELFGDFVALLEQLVSILIPFTSLTLFFLDLAYLVLCKPLINNLIRLLDFLLRGTIFALVTFRKRHTCLLSWIQS